MWIKLTPIVPAILCLCSALTPAALLAAPPPNDNFFQAEELPSVTEGDVSGTTHDATKEPGEADIIGPPSGHTVWYRWQVPMSGLISFSTINTDPLIDRQFHCGVYAGETVTQLSAVTSCGSEASVFQGDELRIGVESRGGGDLGGPFDLTWHLTVIPPPPNDDFEAADTIPGDSGRVTGSNLLATREANEPVLPTEGIGGTAGRSVWYTWTAPRTGSWTFTTDGTITTDLDTILCVFENDQLPTLAVVACDDDLVTELQFYRFSSVTFDAVANHTYHIVVDGFADANSEGHFLLNWAPTPSSHLFASAEDLGDAPSGSMPGNNLGPGIGAESGEPDHRRDPLCNCGRSIWYRWVAPSTGLWTFDTAGSNFNTLLAVYTGSDLPHLTEIARNDDVDPNNVDVVSTSSVSFECIQGETYRIAIDGSLSRTGPPFGTLSTIVAGLSILNWAVVEPTPTATDTQTPTPTSTVTSTSTFTHTFTATHTNTPAPSSTHTLTATPTSTPTRTFTQTFTSTPTSTPTPSFTHTFTKTPTHTPTLTPPALTPTDTPGPADDCIGDCDGSNVVTIDELIRTVTLALHGGDPGSCPGIDRNADGRITIDELIAAVDRALNGCET